MTDRVRPLKLEAPSEGGTQLDMFPTELNHNQDYVDARGAIFQNDTSNDTLVGLDRNSASDELRLFDSIAGSVLLNALTGVPYIVPSGVTYPVATNKQALIGINVTVDGFIQTDGYLVEAT